MPDNLLVAGIPVWGSNPESGPNSSWIVVPDQEEPKCHILPIAATHDGWGARQAGLGRSGGEQSVLLNSPHDIVDIYHQDGESDTFRRQ
jgi:hypothetical protein